MNFLACDLGGTKVLIAIYEEVNKYSPPKLIQSLDGGSLTNQCSEPE